MSRQLISQTWSIDQIASNACPVTWEPVFQATKGDIHAISQELSNR